MPLTKDFFETQEYSKPISQFVGDNNELYSQILGERTKNYYQNMANYQLIDSWSKNMNVLPQDELIKQDVLNRVKTGIQDTVDKGDYETATKKIMQLAHNVKSDPLVNRAETNAATRQQFVKETLDRVGKDPKEGGITSADAQAIIRYNDQKYQGATTSSYNPESIGKIKSAREIADEISKNFKPTASGKLQYRGGTINDPFMEKYGFTAKDVDPNELREAIYRAAINDRDYMQSQRDLIKFHGLRKQPSMEEVIKLYPSLDKDKKPIVDANGLPMYNTDAYKEEITKTFNKPFEELTNEEIDRFNSAKLEDKQIYDDINLAADTSILQYAKRTEYTPFLDRDWNKLYELNQQKVNDNYQMFSTTEHTVLMGDKFDLKESENNLQTLREINSKLLGDATTRPDKKLTPEETIKYNENSFKIRQIESANDAVKTAFLNSEKSDKIFNSTGGNYFNNKLPYADKFGVKTIGDSQLEKLGLTRKDIINHLIGIKTIDEKTLDSEFETNVEPIMGVIKSIYYGGKNYFKPTLRDVIKDISDNLTDEANSYAKKNPVKYVPKTIHTTTKDGKPTLLERSLEDRWTENTNWTLFNPTNGKMESRLLVMDDLGIDEKNYNTEFTLNSAGTYDVILTLKDNVDKSIKEKLIGDDKGIITLSGEPTNTSAKQKEQDFASQINTILGQNGYNVPDEQYYNFSPIPNFQVEQFSNDRDIEAYRTLVKVIADVRFGSDKGIIEERFKNPKNYESELIDLKTDNIVGTITTLFNKSKNVEFVNTPAYGEVKILPVSMKQENGIIKNGFIAQIEVGDTIISSLGIQGQGDGTFKIAGSIDELITAIGTYNYSLMNKSIT